MEDMAIFMAILFGLLVGSFLNVVVYRMPVMLNREWDMAAREQLGLTEEFVQTLPENAAETLRQKIRLNQDQTPFNWVVPRSHCRSCGAPVRAWQNIPIVSWLILRGQCHTCQAPISKRYPLVELLTGLAFGVVAWRYGWNVVTVFGCLMTALIIALVFIDADHQILPDDLVLPLFGLGLLFNWYTGFVPLSQVVLGVLCGYGSLWLIFRVYQGLTGKEGMGYGDFKMLAAIGAWLGASSLLVVVMFASLVGIVAAVAKGVKRGQPMAFGPCLGIAGWVVFVFHHQVMMAVNWWLHHSGF